MDETLLEYSDDMIMGWFWYYADDGAEDWAREHSSEFDRMCMDKAGELIESIQCHANDDAKELAYELVLAITREIGE